MGEEGCESCCAIATIVILVLAGFFSGRYIGAAARRDAERALAVKAGVGWYESDPATGTTTFFYGRPPGARR